MAAQIPIKNDVLANELALQKVKEDKIREVTDGHDGTWVAHPGLVPIAKAVFDKYMPEPHQIDRHIQLNKEILFSDLAQAPIGTCTLEGLKYNINIFYQYFIEWIKGKWLCSFK